MGRQVPNHLMRSSGNHAFLHFDLDSPRTLLRFWGFGSPVLDLEPFFEKSLSRVFDLLEKFKAPATLFCIGNELEESPMARRSLLDAHRRGHELANHTYSHPFGLTQLKEEEWKKEITNCSRVIAELTGEFPRGFRSPGYDMNHTIINFLETQSFTYDSSAFWSSINPIARIYHKLRSREKMHNGLVRSSKKVPKTAYYPSATNWIQTGTTRNILEIPLPRVGPIGLPFYNGFLLSLGSTLARFLVGRMRQPSLVYLFHLIEFVDMTDDLPEQLSVHPNLKIPATRKIQQISEILTLLSQRYLFSRSDAFVDGKSQNSG